MKKAIVFLLIVTIILLVAACDMVNLTGGGNVNGGGESSMVKWAGIRVSEYGMEDAYGEGKFPSVTKMKNLIGKMSSLYDGSTGTAVLIVGTISAHENKSGNITEGSCSLEFPLSKEISKAWGSDKDFYDSYLTAFDNAGYSVWLQVEPGDADLVELATEVMSHYSKHKCVKGFGIDVEWYQYRYTKNTKKEESTKLSDEEAEKVVKAVREINPNYTVFVKHWDEEWLPPTYREGLVFISDSQGFKAWYDMSELDNMRKEFSDWAEHFAPNPVMFQIGYRADREKIWSQFSNPAKELGEYIAKGCTSGNDIGIIWVDFTLKEVLN